MTTVSSPRSSNLELFRIIVMLLIIAHHYVVNSGLFQLMESTELTANSAFLYLWGMWGKIGINCFVLITGYFMCRSEATVRKFFKLLLEVVFYSSCIYLLFVAAGKIAFHPATFLLDVLPVTSVSDGFTSAFLLFYPLIPFLNALIRNLGGRSHLCLIGLCLFIYTFLYMVPLFEVHYNYVSWFAVLYLIAAYLRLHPHPRYDRNLRFWTAAMAGSVALSAASIFLLHRLGKFAYWLVVDSNAVMAVAVAVSAFMVFKNLDLRYSKTINAIGASTFGIFLIHTNSETMRHWIWYDLLDNKAFFDHPLLWLHAVASVILVFGCCLIIDQLRIFAVERPLDRCARYQKWLNRLHRRLPKP